MMEGLQISIPQRMMLIRITLVVSLIVSVLLSLNLWGGYRSVPYAAIITQQWLKPPYDYVYTGLLIFSWAASLFLNKQRVFIFFSVVISILLVLMDVQRLQPWFYNYTAMLTVFIFYNGRVDDSNKFTAYFIILQTIFASVYFFCGLSQLNSFFVSTDFLEIISPLRHLVSERQFLFFNKLGFVTPYMLMFIGLGLVISPIRYLAITLALLMHVVLLIFLFPSAKNPNYALWLSNLSFMVILFLLFSGKTKQRYFSPTFLFQIPFFYIVVMLFVILPFFNNSGLWPDHLSSNFKSGNNTSAMISLSQNAADKLPAGLRKYCSPHYTFQIFDYKKWVREELHADCFPGEPAFNSIYNYLRDLDKGPVKEIELQVIPKQKLLFKR